VRAGCGLNVSNKEPTTCVADIIKARRTQLAAQEDGPRAADTTDAGIPGREVMLAAIMGTLEANLSTFRREGFPALEGAYLRHWLHTNQSVTLEEPVAAASASPSARHHTRLMPHTIRGLTASGYLLAEDADGQRFELHPDGNSLDFFAGLVRKKLPR
jgi:biotin--protein ligase